MKYEAIFPGEYNMVSHKRLQQYKRYYGKTCMTGIYGCRWHRYQQCRDSTGIWDVGWFCLLVLLLLFMLSWLLYWVAAYNDDTLINEIVFEELGTYYNWHEVLLAVTGATFAYVAILFILALLHAAYGHELYLHGLHKLMFVFVLTGCIITAYFATILWPDGWTLLYLSILGNWPFIHLTIVVVMTFLTLLIAKLWNYIYSMGAKVASLAFFIAVIVFIYLSPLLVAPPCVIDQNNLPPPPNLIAHRGGAAMAPENTLLAFQWSSNLTRVTTFECDIQLSADGVPFLLRDRTLRRTTNVSDQFNRMENFQAVEFNISQLTSLNAGKWFLDNDPFHIVESLSDEEKDNIRKQTVPTLEEVVEFVKTTNKSLLLHILPPPRDRSQNEVLQAVRDVIVKTGIDPMRIFWPNATEIVNESVPFARVLERSETRFEVLNASIQLVNLPYRATNFRLFEMYQSRELNLSVNLFTVNSRWLYSICWCAGITSVTTNQVKTLNELREPLWVMRPQVYLGLWVVVDAVSACVIVIIFLYHRIKKSGVMFNPETLSLQAMQHRIHQNHQNKNMKEKLLHTAESIQDMDSVMLRVDSPSSPPTPATPATLETPTTPISPLTPNTTHSNGTVPSNGISYSHASGFFGGSLIPPGVRKENGVHPDSSINKAEDPKDGVINEIPHSDGGHENRASGFFDDVPCSELEVDNSVGLSNGSVNVPEEEVAEEVVKPDRKTSLNTEIQRFFAGSSLAQTVLDRFERSAAAAAEEEEEAAEEEGGSIAEQEAQEEKLENNQPPNITPVSMVNGYHGDQPEPVNRTHTQDVPLSVQPTVAIETATQEHKAIGPACVSDVKLEID